jgi:hypothetical protein
MRVVVHGEGNEVGVHIGFPWLTAFQQTRCQSQANVRDSVLAKKQEPTGTQVLKIQEIPRTELTDKAGLCYLGQRFITDAQEG